MEKKIDTNKVKVPGISSTNIAVISEGGLFRLRKILVSKEIDQNFFITDIRVGKNSQFVSPGAIPASFFTDGERQNNIHFDTLYRGGVIELSVFNMHKEEQEFFAVLTGDVLSNYPQEDARDHLFMGLGHTIVSSNCAAVINLKAQIAIEPNGLIIPPEVSDGFIVQDVRAVGESVKESERDFKTFKANMLQIDDWFSVTVKNKTDIARPFYGTVIGKLPKKDKKLNE